MPVEYKTNPVSLINNISSSFRSCSNSFWYMLLNKESTKLERQLRRNGKNLKERENKGASYRIKNDPESCWSKENLNVTYSRDANSGAQYHPQKIKLKSRHQKSQKQPLPAAGQIFYSQSGPEVNIDERLAQRRRQFARLSRKTNDDKIEGRQNTDKPNNGNSFSHQTKDDNAFMKRFTKEEIEQMSTHHKKKVPSYIKQPRYVDSSLKKISGGRFSKEESKYTGHESTQQETRHSMKMKNSGQEKANVGCASFPRTNQNQLEALNNNLSPSLLKLQEQTNDETKSSQTRYKSKNSLKTILKQSSLPAPTRRNDFYAETCENKVLHSSSHGDLEGITDGSNLLKGKVIFTMDMDEVEPRGKRDASFFRRKILRKKQTKTASTGTQMEIETITQSMQANPYAIPGLMKSQVTQTAKSNLVCSSTQTNDAPLTNDAQVQCSPLHNNSYCQTEQETKKQSPADPSYVSLDELVRHRKQRRAKSVINKKTQEMSGELKRSATVHGRSKVGDSEKAVTKKPIKAYNWSQTEKFVKIIVSHNGIHLIPVNQISVKSNGFDLKLVIEESDSPANLNRSNNNNNDCLVTMHELNINRLTHPVAHLSYKIQPDMVIILLRKKTEKSWQELEKKIAHQFVLTAAQVYL